MNNASWRYYVLNQIFVGGDLTKLPEEAVQVCREAKVDLASVASKLNVRPRLVVGDAVLALFLQYLRTPQYAMCVLGESQRLIAIEQVASIVRSKDYNIEGYWRYAEEIISEVVYEDIKIPQIKDGALYIPTELREQGYNLVSAMHEAFELYCWGVFNASPEHKRFVQRMEHYLNPVIEIGMSAKQFKEIIDLCCAQSINPATLSNTVFRVHDLSKSVDKFKVLAWWDTVDHSNVKVLLSRKSGDKLIPAVIPANEFLPLAVGDDGASRLYVKGDRIAIEGESA